LCCQDNFILEVYEFEQNATEIRYGFGNGEVLVVNNINVSHTQYKVSFKGEIRNEKINFINNRVVCRLQSKRL
jgi:hypothetical protein